MVQRELWTPFFNSFPALICYFWSHFLFFLLCLFASIVGSLCQELKILCICSCLRSKKKKNTTTKKNKNNPPPPTTKQEKQPPSPQQKSKKATDYLTVHVIWGFVFKEEQFKECELYVVFVHEYMLFFFHVISEARLFKCKYLV